MNPDPFLNHLLNAQVLSEQQVRSFKYELECEQWLADAIDLGLPVDLPPQRASKRLQNV